mmetsp:Transcript_31418/g.45800  ORF Transcript_31418/g.45800 Transcript_31418/m.45800 type:complete len:378 (-) Transcript_31418:365-1498(-)
MLCSCLFFWLIWSLLISTVVFGFSSARGFGGNAVSTPKPKGGRLKSNKNKQSPTAVQHQHQQHPLLNWLETFPEAKFESISIRPSLCGDGMGGFLTKSVQNGEVVFVVPSDAFVSVGNALQHPTLGPQFQKLWMETAEDDPKGTSVLAAFVGHSILNMQRNDNYCTNRAYLDMLPTNTPKEKHPLWWSDAEMELLRGTSAMQEWMEMREDVDEMIRIVIDSSVLLDDIVRYGLDQVELAVRAGFVAVLSRAYGVFSDSLDDDRREFKALIPLLDALNHADEPNVMYSYEGSAATSGRDGLSGVLIARAVGSHEKGDELTISYGSHPNHVFGLYFGFVPERESHPVDYSSLVSGGGVRQCCKEMAFLIKCSEATAILG